MASYTLRLLFSTDFLGQILTQAKINGFINQMCYVYYNFVLIGTGETNVKTASVTSANFVDSSFNTTTHVFNIKYIKCEFNITSSVPSITGVQTLHIPSLKFVKNTSTGDDYAGSYYLLRNDGDSQYSDLKTPFYAGDGWVSDGNDNYYKNIFVTVVTTDYNSNPNSPVCTSVRFSGFDKLPFNLNNITYYYKSATQKSVVNLGGSAYTSIVLRDNTDFNDLVIETSNYESALPLLSKDESLNTFGYQAIYSLSNGSTAEYKYGGFDELDDSNFASRFAGQFTTVNNTGNKVYPNEVFRNLYPARAEGSTYYSESDAVQSSDWYKERFTKESSYTSGSSAQINSANYSYELIYKALGTGKPKNITLQNNNIVVNSKDVLQTNGDYLSYIYLSSYYLGPLTVSYSNMYHDSGFFDIYYSNTYQLSKSYEVKYGYLQDFGAQSTTAAGLSDGHAHYTGWVDNNADNYNDYFKLIYNNILKYKVSLFGSYLAMSESTSAQSTYYNKNIESITKDTLSAYTPVTYVLKDLKTVTPSNTVTAEDFWGANTAYKTVFKEFTNAVDWEYAFKNVRLQTAFYNNSKSETPYVNGDYSYIGLGLALDTAYNPNYGSIVFDNEISNGYRSSGTGYHVYNYLRVPINITEKYELYYTYFNNKNNTYSGVTINLNNGLILGDNLLGKNLAVNNRLNTWRYSYNIKNFSDLTHTGLPLSGVAGATTPPGLTTTITPKVINPINNMFVEAHTYNFCDTADVALGGNSEVVIAPVVTCSLPGGASKEVLMRCSFNNMPSSKYADVNVIYKLSYSNVIGDSTHSDAADILSKLTVGSARGGDSVVSDSIKTLTQTDGANNDNCKFNIYKVEDGRNSYTLLNYADVVITVDCSASDYRFSKFAYSSGGTITAGGGDGAVFNTGIDGVTGKFKYSGTTYTVTFSGVNTDNADAFASASTRFNFTDPSNTYPDYLYIVNGFSHPVHVNGGNYDLEIASGSVNTAAIEYQDRQEFNIYSNCDLFEFPFTANRNQATVSYFSARSFDATSTSTAYTTVNHYCYLNQYHQLNTYNGKLNFGLAYSDVITLKPAFTDKLKRVSYIYLGAASSYTSVVSKLGLTGKFSDYRISYNSYDTVKNDGSYKWNLSTLSSESIYNIPAIFNKDRVKDALAFYETSTSIPVYGAGYLNIEFISDSSLPAFELNNNLYKYKNAQEKTAYNTSFGNIKPLKISSEIELVAYYKPISTMVSGKDLTVSSSIQPADQQRLTNYLINNYNYEYSSGSYYSIFNIPVTETVTSTNAGVALVLDDILVRVPGGDLLSFDNAYLDYTIANNLHGAYLKTYLNNIPQASPSTFYKTNSEADAKFNGETSYTVLGTTRRELAKLLISYYSYQSISDNESDWNSWGKNTQTAIGNIDNVYEKFPFYEPSYNGTGVGICMLGTGISNRESYINTYPGLYDNTRGNSLGGKYTATFITDSNNFAPVSDFGDKVNFNGYVSTSFNIKNTVSLVSESDGSTIYFRIKLNDTVIPGLGDYEYTTEADYPTTTINLSYGISLQDIYNDSKRSLSDTSLVSLYNTLSSRTGTSNLSLAVDDLEIVNIGVQEIDSQTVVWAKDPDDDKISNYSIVKKQTNSNNYWSEDGNAIDLANVINTTWVRSGQTINVNATSATNVLQTIDISDLIDIKDYKRIPYYIAGVNIKLDDEMFNDTTAGELSRKSNLYNYLKTVYFDNNPLEVHNIGLETDIYITDMYFSDNSERPTDNIQLGTGPNDFKLQFYVSPTNIPVWDAIDNISNKRAGNNGSIKQFFNINGEENTLTMGFDAADTASTASAENNVYKFYAADCKNDDLKTYKLFTKLNFNKDLYIKYEIKIGSQERIVLTQRLNLLNNLKSGYMRLSDIKLSRKDTTSNPHWGMQTNNMPTFTITNDIISQICPVMEHAIYFKAIKNKPYVINYTLYDTVEDDGVQSTLTVDGADEIIDVQKNNGELYNYLKVLTINYNGITVGGYTIRISDYYKFTD